MQESFYPEKIMGYLLSLPNSGAMPNDKIDNQSVFMIEVGSLDKGFVIKLFIDTNPINKIINKMNYLVYGDGYIIAALGKLSEDLSGLKYSQVINYSMAKLSKELEIPINKLNDLKLIKTKLDELISRVK